ncbi:MAG TPA: alanine dehydrogenase [Trueperaceae bacterium]|nr:alanine dehydrogenase [Trueperaceae bacterium]
MDIGIPKEIKPQEYRVAATPGAVHALSDAGHHVFVEARAGEGSGFFDDDYRGAGATIVDSAAEAWSKRLVLKVKEPIAGEFGFLRDDLILFTYLHLAAERPLTEALVASGTTAIAYETVQLSNGSLPLLTPMSEVAGRMATQVGAHYLGKFLGGRGLLLGGVPGVEAGEVVVLGGGVVGTNAAKIAMGLGARVTILDINHARLQYLDDVFGGRIQTLASNLANIRAMVERADLVVGAVLIPGARAPHLVTRDMLTLMRPGSVIVDVAVDQGGCIETIHPTTHDAPTFVVDGVVHYGVANMPGAVPNTSTRALSNQTLPYALALAAGGTAALMADTALLRGLNTHAGRLTYAAVGEAFGLPTFDPRETLSSRAHAAT